MRLKKYMDTKGLRPQAFADMIGTHRSAVDLWIQGRRRPNWLTMDKIMEKTGGKVKPNDFIPDPPNTKPES